MVQDVASVAGLRLPSLKFGTASEESNDFLSYVFSNSPMNSILRILGFHLMVFSGWHSRYVPYI